MGPIREVGEEVEDPLDEVVETEAAEVFPEEAVGTEVRDEGNVLEAVQSVTRLLLRAKDEKRTPPDALGGVVHMEVRAGVGGDALLHPALHAEENASHRVRDVEREADLPRCARGGGGGDL